MNKRALDPHLWNIETLFKSIYEVPVYQRPYSWDEEQINDLLDDVIEAYKSKDKDEGYYTGNIIVYDKNDKIHGNIIKFDIIDGQQRITTFALILLALYSFSKSIGINENEKILRDIKDALWKYITAERSYSKDLKAVTLNSIEKKCFSDLYDCCYDLPEKVLSFCEEYECKSSFDERIINNFKTIYDKIRENVSSDNQDEILLFADYVLRGIQFIVIEANYKANKVFSMFESINSKGKKLQVIDLIKTYIFSRLDETSYDIYSKKWGDLIIKTKDNLEDYLYNYLRAYIYYFRQKISIKSFKAISKKELLTHFKESNIAEALKKLLDDMYDKVEYYNMLSSETEASSLFNNKQFKFYFRIFTELSYQHPKALFFRTLVDCKEERISKDDVVSIVRETVTFMMKFLSISNRDSKDAITMFVGMMNEIYEQGSVTKDIVVNYIANELSKQQITPEKLKMELRDMDAYEQKRDIAKPLLSLYESISRDSSGKIKPMYDQAYTIYSSFSESFSFDHLLVQTPPKDSDEFKYYKDEKNNTLVLKEGHDFPEKIQDGMDYDEFTRIVLNKIGNLRIYYKDKNSSRHTATVLLKEYGKFVTYNDIVNRGNDIIDTIIDDCLPAPKVDLFKLQSSINKKRKANYPKMDKLIKFGIVKPGDKLYIIVKPKESVATLIDEKYVEFNGEKLTLNEWGCRVTGWNSIGIYAYTAIVGENETLHHKRLAFIKKNNETSS